jgi:hypothetical protein
LPERDAVHRLGQIVAAFLAALCRDEPRLAQLHQDLVQKPFGQIFPRDDLLRGQKGLSRLGGDAEVDQRAQGIFAAFGNLHASLV